MNLITELSNKLTLEQTKWIIIGTAIFIGLLFLIFLLLVFRSKKNSNVKVFDLIDSQLRERKRGFIDYERLDAYIKKNGVDFHYSFIGEPLKYILFCIACSGGAMLVGSVINPFLAVAGCVLGAIFPNLLVKMTVQKENEEIMEDIKMIYNSITAQIQSGIYVSVALAECSSPAIIKNKRLLKEMQRMSANIQLTSDIQQSTNEFSKRFNNIYIDSLGIIICQALESGKATEALSDISKQLKDVERNLFDAKRERKQLRNFAYEMALFGTAIFYLLLSILPALTGGLSGMS